MGVDVRLPLQVHIGPSHMSDTNSVSEKYVPARILMDYSIRKAYVAKVGFVRFELSDSFKERWSANTGTDHKLTDEYVDALYSTLEKSPHIMEIAPSRQELRQQLEGSQVGIRVWAHEVALSLTQPLLLRVVLPKRKREELGLFPWSWNPEEFTIFFDGALFVAYAPVNSVPVTTDLGQIARDFLVETLAPANLWRHVNGFGPTPIHPELYFIRAAQHTSAAPTALHLPIVKEAEGDVVIVVSDSDGLDVITRPLLRDVSLALDDFYGQRVAARTFTDAVDALADLDRQLSERVSQYFKLSTLRCLFSNESRSIRKLIAEMHMALQRVSSAEMEMRRQQDKASRSIAESTFFKGIQSYFKEHMTPDTIFDREAELTSMNFAAEETSNFAVTQTTIVAALAGAILGGIFTALVQYLAK